MGVSLSPRKLFGVDLNRFLGTPTAAGLHMHVGCGARPKMERSDAGRSILVDNLCSHVVVPQTLDGVI